MENKFLPTIMARLRAVAQRTDSPVAHAISGTTASSTGQYGGVYTPYGGGWDVEKAVHDGYEKVIWVFRCVDAIASNQAKLKMVVRNGDPDSGNIVDDKQLNYTLNRRANKFETAKAFRYRLSSQLLLSKRGAFIEKRRAPSGRWELYLLPAHLVEPVPDPVDFVKGYWLMDANNGQVWLEKENVIWIKLKPHPVDPYLQMTPLTSAGLAIETDWLARLFNRNFLANDGRPGMLINVRGQLNSQDAAELKARFGGSPHTAGRVSVVEADDINVNDMGASPRDSQWLEAINGSKDDLLLAFGTPESVLGNASGRTYDNADAEAEVWWEETMVPHCGPIGDGLDILTGSYDDDKFVGFDYDSVDVLQRRKRARHDKATEEFSKGVRTLDSVLEVRGEKPWDLPATRSFFLPTGVIISQTPEDTTAVAKLPVLGVQQQADVQKQAQLGAQQGVEQGQRNFSNIIASRASQLSTAALPARIEQKAVTGEVENAEIVYDDERVHPYQSLREISEHVFSEALDEWSSFQGETTVQRLEHPKARMYTRHWEGGPETKGAPKKGNPKPLNTRYVVDKTRWANNIENAMSGAMRKVVASGIRQATSEMADSGIDNVMHSVGLGNAKGRTPALRVYGSRQDLESAAAAILEPFTDLVQKAAERQSDRLAAKIAEMDAEGASMTEIKKAVQDMVGARGSWKTGLAQALTTSLIESARHSAYSQAGNIVTKFWNTMEDEKVRATHEHVDGKELPIDKPYKVGSSLMQYPGDPRGEVGERINCRCYADYAISTEAEELYEAAAYRD